MWSKQEALNEYKKMLQHLDSVGVLDCMPKPERQKWDDITDKQIKLMEMDIKKETEAQKWSTE